jgi:hypothetical protein
VSITSDRHNAAPARPATGTADARARRGASSLENWARRTTAGAQESLRGLLPRLVVVAVAALAARPLLDHRLVAGHDALEHAMRVAEYARAIQGGVWWPAWAPNLGHGYGEPIFLFNPPLFYLLASIPTLAGLPATLAINLTVAALLIVAALGVYAWTRPLLGRAGGIVAAAAYAWAPYVLLDVYVRQALTELTAVSVLPWALWGLARTCASPGPRRIAVAALAIACLLLASTPATVVTAPALVGQVLVLTGSGRARGTARGVVALGLATLLAAGFWIPVAVERDLLRFDRLLTNQPAYHNHFLELSQLFSSFWGYGISAPGREDRMGFGLGEAHLTLAGLGVALLLARRVHRLAFRQAWLAVAITAVGVAMALPLSRVLWDELPDLQYLQFPWRFLLLPALGCSFLAAVPTAVVARRHPGAGAALALGCTLALVAASWSRAAPGDLEELSNEDLTAMAIGLRDRGRGTAYEYETIWTQGRPVDPPDAPMTLNPGRAHDVEERFGGNPSAGRDGPPSALRGHRLASRATSVEHVLLPRLAGVRGRPRAANRL